MSYWEVLAEATVALRRDALAEAERLFLAARDERERSPGRVFVSETVADAARRLWRRARGQSLDEALAAGRWPAAAAAFRAEFQARGDAVTRAAARAAEAPDAAPDPALLPVLAEALFLLGSSQLHPPDPAAAARALRAAVAAASRGVRPLPPALLRHDLPLSEEDRVGVGRRAVSWLPALAAAGTASGAQVAELAAAVLRLLAANWFDPAGRFAVERAYLEASLTDAHLADPAAAVRLYRSYLTHFAPAAGRPEAARADAARLRLAELLGNVDDFHFPVPRYAEALACLPAACAPELAGRERVIRRALAYRRPGTGAAAAWATVAVHPEGVVWVLWWGDSPRDVARWRPGDDAEPLRRFLAPCGGRVVREDAGGRWAEAATAPELLGLAAAPFLEALLEPLLPADGLTPAARASLAASATAAWRQEWESGVGHARLAPPRGESRGALDDPEVGPALDAGLLWLAALRRLDAAGPAATAGVRLLAGQGDQASAMLAAFLAADIALKAAGRGGAAEAQDAGPEPAWAGADDAAPAARAPGGAGRDGPLTGVAAFAALLPPLARRPGLDLAPVDEGPAGEAADSAWRSSAAVGRGGAGPSLACTGRPGAALAAWGAGHPRWRVVIDSRRRLAELGRTARAAGRSVTLAPADGVHAREAALAWLAERLAGGRGGAGGSAGPGVAADAGVGSAASGAGAAAGAAPDLLPLFHWLRLVETHNGDLLDFLAVRPRAVGALPLVDRYREAIAALPRLQPGATTTRDPWVEQYRARAADAPVLAGSASQLPDDAGALAAVWGVAAGGEAAWVFWDSARIHWQLWRQGRDPAALHARLAACGRRLLALIVGGGLWRDELAAQHAEWLRAYGPLASLDADAAEPGPEAGCLALVEAGVDPGAHVLILFSLAGQLIHLERLAASPPPAPPPLVLLPERGRAALFWSAWATRRLPAPLAAAAGFLGADDLWSEEGPPPELAAARLVVPALDSLAEPGLPAPDRDSPRGWREADRLRGERLRRLGWASAVEVNALLASGARVVDVADSRWWRWFPWRRQAGEVCRGEGEPGPQTAAGAAAVAGASRYDLAESGPPGRGAGVLRKRRAEDDRVAALRAWLREQGWVGAEGRGAVPGLASGPRVAETPAAARRWLHLGPPAKIWAVAAQALAEARERGDLGAWLLIAGPRVPAGAALLAGAYPGPGATRWPPDRDGVASPGVSPSGTATPAMATGAGAPSPTRAAAAPGGAVVWIEPAALAEPALQGVVAERPPLLALACDLQDWLPVDAEPRAAAAGALRFLLDGPLPCVVAQAAALPAAWERFFGAYWDGYGRDGALTRASAGGPERAAPLPVGRVPALRVPCHDCGAGIELADWSVACPACGLEYGRWLSPAARRDLLDRALRAQCEALRQQTAAAADAPLEIWVPSARCAEVSEALGALDGAARAEEGRVVGRWPPGAAWQLAPEDGWRAPRAGARQALLLPPATLADALRWRVEAADPAAAGPSLWYHGLEVSANGQEELGAALQCVRELAARWHGSVSGGVDPAWRGLLPPAVAEAVSGRDGAGLAAAAALLAWLRAFAPPAGAVPTPMDDGADTGGADRTPSVAAAGRRPWRLRVLRPLLEIEYRLAQAGAVVERALPRLLGDLAPGAVTECDLAEFPVPAAPEELAWADRLLLACSLAVRQTPPAAAQGADLFQGATGHEELLWQAPAGCLLSTRRLAGYLGRRHALPARLREWRERLLAQTGALLARAAAAPDGPVIEGDGAALAPDSEPLLAAGCLLGFWRVESGPEAWLDPRLWAGFEALAWPASAPAARLGRDLGVERSRWRARLEQAGRDGVLLPDQPEPAGGGDVGEPAPPPAAARLPEGRAFMQARERAVAALAGSGPGLLVLRGPTGAGKREVALAALLEAAERGAASPEAVPVYCPNVGWAASVALAWRQRTLAPWPGLEIAGEAAAGGDARGGAGPAAAGAGPGILLGAETMPRQARYALAQRHRDGRLLVAVDPAAAEEPWEHLFLATPRADEVAELADQRRQGRLLWEQARRLGEAATGGRWRGKALRKERGEWEARWAASLDDCVALLTGEQAAGRLGRRVGVVAGLRDDLVFLGRALAAQGWRPVFRWELDALLLPGTLEFTALVHDLAARDGISLLAPLLPDAERAGYRRWRAGLGERAAPTLREAYALASRASWSRPFLARPALRRRVERLVADAGEEPPAKLVERPLGEAWRLELAALAAAPAAALRGPVATLATPESVGETGCDTLVYLCTGHEPTRRHYRVVSRAVERLLVLYQEKSPLEEEGEGGDG